MSPGSPWPAAEAGNSLPAKRFNENWFEIPLDAGGVQCSGAFKQRIRNLSPEEFSASIIRTNYPGRNE